MISSSVSSIKLNSTPIEPDCEAINAWLENDDSVIHSQAKAWIKAHHEYYQPALKALTKNIVRIKHSNFKQHLHEAVKHFNGELAKTTDQSYIALVQPGKSNQWVAELALQYVANEPTESLSLGEKQAKDFCQYLDTISKTHEVAKRIVLFDDASYSGTQLTEHVKAIFDKFKELGKKAPTVHVVAPFATQHAYRKLRALPQYEEGQLKLSIHAKIKSVADVLSSDHVARLKELYGWSDGAIETEGRGVTYFDHKIPNGMSFVEPFATGSVYPGRGDHQLSKEKIDNTHYINLPPVKPPYKG